MRRALLTQRAQRCPDDLRAKLILGRKKDSPKKTIHVNPDPFSRRIPKESETESEAEDEKPEPEIIRQPILSIKRTVKNEQARNPNSIIIDTWDSSDEEEDEIKIVHKRKRRRSR